MQGRSRGLCLRLPGWGFLTSLCPVASECCMLNLPGHGYVPPMRTAACPKRTPCSHPASRPPLHSVLQVVYAKPIKGSAYAASLEKDASYGVPAPATKPLKNITFQCVPCGCPLQGPADVALELAPLPPTLDDDDNADEDDSITEYDDYDAAALGVNAERITTEDPADARAQASVWANDLAGAYANSTARTTIDDAQAVSQASTEAEFLAISWAASRADTRIRPKASKKAISQTGAKAVLRNLRRLF